MTEPSTLTQHRAQLARVLASPGFQSSKQTREFLQYVCERVFAGSQEIEQTEIARDVLGRADFDPTTDASVRKLATSARQRLERYYEGAGAADELVIRLPLRSYAPQFELRAHPTVVEPQPLIRPRPKRVWLRAAVPGTAILVVLVLLAVWRFRPAAAEEPQTIRIETGRGDLTQPAPDASPGGLRLGTPLGLADSIVAELAFRPEHEGQHAGLILWEGPTRYVSLGRRFTSRNYFTFGFEYDSYLNVPAGNESFDMEGQSGRPVWLRLVRNGRVFRAFLSPDGVAWTRFGNDLNVPLSASARAGVFAVNGRRPSPSIQAQFRLAGKGPALSGLDLPGTGWQFGSTCPGGASLVDAPPESSRWPPCQATWTRDFSPAKPPVWSTTTRIDAASSPALATGLFVHGSRGRLRIVRYHGETPSIALIHDGRFLHPVPDYPGSPPVYLRLRGEATAGGVVVAECSVDGSTFRPVGPAVPASALGKLDSFGLVISKRTPVNEPMPSPRLFFVQEDLFPLELIRFAPPS